MDRAPRAGHGEDPSAHPAARTTTERWHRIWGYRALLLWVARQHGFDADGAEDVVQEAMLRAADHPEVVDERLQAWLVRVTIRLCMDGHRRRTQEASGWQRLAASTVSQEPGPEEAVGERLEAAWVASVAANVLPPRQAEALRLMAAGHDVHQIARDLGVGYRAAESLLARARRNLRIALPVGFGALALLLRVPLHAVSEVGDSVSVGLAATASTAVVVVVLMMMIIPLVSPSVDQPASPLKPPGVAAPPVSDRSRIEGVPLCAPG